jgi:hypothetical protein
MKEKLYEPLPRQERSPCMSKKEEKDDIVMEEFY